MSKPIIIPPKRENVFALADHNSNCIRCVMLGNSHYQDHNDRLVQMVSALGRMAGYFDRASDTTSFRTTLTSLFGFTFGWLMSQGVQYPFNAIHRERERQEQLFKAGRLTFTGASTTASPSRKLRVLTEEIGEVAEAIERLERRDSKINRDHLVNELVQVAAVAVAWLESFETQPSTQGTK